MMAEALKRIGASDASMIGTVGPVITIFLGVAFLGEQVSLLQLVGAALVLAGVAMISLNKAAPGSRTPQRRGSARTTTALGFRSSRR